MWLVSASLIAHLLLAATSLRESRPQCSPTVASPRFIIGQPGENIILPCPEGELQNATILQWKFKGRILKSQNVSGSSLFLPSVMFNASGLYSCHDGPRQLHNVTLMVEEPPEAPKITCSRRSMVKGIVCTWKSSRPMSMRTEVRMWVQNGFMGANHTEQKCRYYSKSQKFSCSIESQNSEDDDVLKVFVCVANMAGAAKQEKYFQTGPLLKPDPPVDVVVSPEEKSPRILHVTWRKPPSWGSNYYGLQFQLRYRAENAKLHTEVHLKDGTTFYTITDALNKLPHTVQVRTREEFDHGTWSEWSRESVGTPWTEQLVPESETTTYLSQFPFGDVSVSTTRPWKPNFFDHTEQPTVVNAEGIPLYTFLIVALSVTVGIALTVAIIFRMKKWSTGSSREGKSGIAKSPTLVPLTSKPPNSASPLISPPASPFSDTSVDSPSVLEHSPYDVSNADYFLLPK